MSTLVDPPYVADTLAWCNERRADKELEPLERMPKGRRRDPLSCPCGKATGLHVERLYWGETSEQRNNLPAAVTEFVKSFDLGMLPQYDEEPEEIDGRFP